VAEIELDDAPVRRELLTLLESKASSKKLNRARQDFFKKLRSDGYSGLRLVKLVHSCSHGEVVANSTDEDLGKIITDLYKKSDPSEQVVIVDFLRDQFTARNLRGAIKNKLMAFNVDGYHPFAFIEQGVRDANTLNVIADVNAGRIRPLQPPAGKRRTKRR
jgi:hypothetical protein